MVLFFDWANERHFVNVKLPEANGSPVIYYKLNKSGGKFLSESKGKQYHYCLEVTRDLAKTYYNYLDGSTSVDTNFKFKKFEPMDFVVPTKATKNDLQVWCEFPKIYVENQEYSY